MKLIGIDIGKNKHFFCVMDQQTGEIISQPVSFSNDKEGFDFLKIGRASCRERV